MTTLHVGYIQVSEGVEGLGGNKWAEEETRYDFLALMAHFISENA